MRRRERHGISVVSPAQTRSDLRRRVEAAEGASAEQAAEQGVTRAALSVLREREASLQGTLLRKEGLLRELRERLEGVQRVRLRNREGETTRRTRNGGREYL